MYLTQSKLNKDSNCEGKVKEGSRNNKSLLLLSVFHKIVINIVSSEVKTTQYDSDHKPCKCLYHIVVSQINSAEDHIGCKHKP